MTLVPGDRLTRMERGRSPRLSDRGRGHQWARRNSEVQSVRIAGRGVRMDSAPGQSRRRYDQGAFATFQLGWLVFWRRLWLREGILPLERDRSRGHDAHSERLGRSNQPTHASGSQLFFLALRRLGQFFREQMPC